MLANRIYTDGNIPTVLDKYGYSEWDYATPPAAFTVANIKNFRMRDVSINIDKELPITAGVHLYNTSPTIENVTVFKDNEPVEVVEVRL